MPTPPGFDDRLAALRWAELSGSGEYLVARGLGDIRLCLPVGDANDGPRRGSRH